MTTFLPQTRRTFLRSAGLKPEAAVLVATIRALKLNGGADKKKLGTEDLGALDLDEGRVGRHQASRWPCPTCGRSVLRGFLNQAP